MATAKKKRKRDPFPEDELAELSAALGRGVPRGVVLRGEERYFRDTAARTVIAAATERGDELCRHDAADPEFSLPRLLDDLTGGALFAAGRCILVDNADPLLKKGARKFSQALIDAMKARLGSREPGCLVVCADNLRADHALVKAIVAADGIIVGCRRLWDTPPPWDPDPRRSELVQWLVGQARKRRVELTPDEGVYVVAATGNDLFSLLDRLESLRHRGAAGVRELVGWDSGGSPWELAERLVDGDAQRAVLGVEALFRAGFHGRDGTRTVDPAALVGMLASAVTARLREVVVGSEALASGAAPADVATAAGVRAGRAQEAFQARLSSRRADQWRTMFDDALAVERRARSGATVDANDFARLALRWARRAR